nr:hypothetical protein CFP56_34710 [Quercus suber]
MSDGHRDVIVPRRLGRSSDPVLLDTLVALLQAAGKDAASAVLAKGRRMISVRLEGRSTWPDRREHRSTHLDTFRIGFDLAPADRLVRPGTRVAAVELLRGVDVDRALGAVPHQTGVRDVMLDDPASQHNHARPLRTHRDGVDAADVLDDVDLELVWRGLEGVEVQHVAQTAVGQGGAEDRDVVPVRPVIHGGLVVDLLAQAGDDFARGPVQGLLLVLGRLLLLQHPVQDGDDPILERAIVAVGNDEVADAVHALLPQACAVGREGAQVGGGQAFDEVLLDPARGRDDGGDVSMLDQPAERLAEAGGDQVRGVTQEDGGAVARRGIAPQSHAIHDPCRLPDGGRLEAHAGHAIDQVGDGQVAIGACIEVETLDGDGRGRDWIGWLEDRVGGSCRR